MIHSGTMDGYLSDDKATSLVPEIWVIDDSRSALAIVMDMLEDEGYAVRGFEKPLEAMERLYEQQPHIIITDIIMPGIDGVSFLEKIYELDRELPVIMMTCNPNMDYAVRSIRFRAFDLLVKPIKEGTLSLTVRRALEFRELQEEGRKSFNKIEEIYSLKIAKLERAIKGLKNTALEAIQIMSAAAEYRGEETCSHINRVGLFSQVMAREMDMTEDFCENILCASSMHDAGNVGLSEAVLMKDSPLSDEEFMEMKLHTKIGAFILREGKSEMLRMAREIALCHHERWDGTGYPSGMVGEDIPASARIVMLADRYDSLRRPRPYRKVNEHEEALKIITQGDGRTMPSHFDPVVLSAFLRVEGEIRDIFDKNSS